MKKRPDLTEATRQRFIDAFSELYAKQPLEKITVTEIAQKAGHNRVTFYQYFHDAYDMLEYLENEFIDFLQQKLRANIKNQKIFDNFVAIFLEIINSQQKTAKILLTGQNAEHTINKIKKAAKSSIVEELALNQTDKKNIYILEFYFSGVLEMLTYWMHSDYDLPEQQLANIIQHILQKGVMPQLDFI